MSVMTEESTDVEMERAELPAARAERPLRSGFNARAAKWATAVILIGSLVLIFTRLGHYALWDDESITAMTGRNVWRTGDTSAWADDHNFIAYRGGLLIRHFKDRYTPPLQFYVVAPFVGLLGDSSFVCRLPFALCGVVTVLLMLRWMWRAKPEPAVWWAAAFLILTNASFFLFQRQCRYYALATVLTAGAAYLYCGWNAGRKKVWALSVVLAALLAAQYLNYAAAVVCLMIDYGIWGRKRRTLSRVDWAVLIVPQVIVGAVVCSIWNPVQRAVEMVGKVATDTASVTTSAGAAHVHGTWFGGFVALYWWNWRDMLASDFIVLPLLLICPLLYFKRKSSWLLRAPLALVIYLGAIALFTAHVVGNAGNAEIRYLAPVLPLCLGISILAVWGMIGIKRSFMVIALCMAGVSMVIEPVKDGDAPIFGSTALAYYKELIHPQHEPYTPTIAWINANIPAGSSLYIRPEWMNYPLMFRAPGPVYAWQLSDSKKPDYVNLPDIHFQYRVPPQYLIAFGPYAKEMGEVRENLAKRGVSYEKIATIHEFWRDEYRPERIWRVFVTPTPKDGEEIYIWKKADAPAKG